MASQRSTPSPSAEDVGAPTSRKQNTQKTDIESGKTSVYVKVISLAIREAADDEVLEQDAAINELPIATLDFKRFVN